MTRGRICSSVLVAVIAIVVGLLLLSPIPKQLGLYRLHASLHPKWIGLMPAHTYGVEWGYTVEELRSSGCDQVRGQTALVTGANSGIGYEIAKKLANCGVDVTLACRSATKCDDAVERIRNNISDSNKNNKNDVSLTTMIMDMSSLESVRDACKAYVETMTTTTTTTSSVEKAPSSKSKGH